MSDVAENGLPEGWKLCKLGDVMRLKNGYAFKSNDYSESGTPLIRISDLKDGVVNLDKAVYIPDALVNKDFLVENGDLLIAMSGATTGKIGVYKGMNPALQNQRVGNFKIVDESVVDKRYRDYYISSLRKDIEGAAYGGAQPNISSKGIEEFEFPLAPPEQQKRIVAKIEELFSHIDAGIVALKKAKQLLKQYRQSVLKAAVTGELTKEWREENKDKLEPASKLLERILETRRQKWEEQQLEQFKAKGKMPKDVKWKEKYKEPKLPNINEKLKIPDTWCWVSGDQSASKIVDGAHHTPKYTESGVPFISVKDIRDDTIHFDDTKFISQETHEQLIQRCHPEKNDLLITKSGTIGRTAIVDTDREFSLFVSVALVKRITDDITPMFFRLMYDFYIQSIDVQQVVKGGMIKNLHLEDMRVVGLPLAPTLEQNIIVEEFEKKIESIRRLENEIDIQLLKAENNKQSVLASAFSGRLQ